MYQIKNKFSLQIFGKTTKLSEFTSITLILYCIAAIILMIEIN